MIIAVCIDDKDGMLFGGRRQSKDRLLRQRLVERSAKLWMNSYSAKQFMEDGVQVTVSEAFLAEAGEEDICFVENQDILPYLSRITGVILYRWNRTYPSDVKFPREELEGKWSLVSALDFSGSSHDIITEEVYTL